MKIKEIKKEIKGVFKPPIKTYFFGKIVHGAPYFNPRGFSSDILTIRKLKLRDTDNYNNYVKGRPWLTQIKDSKFLNAPRVRRNLNWIIKVFSYYFYVSLGWPIAIGTTELGWKDKFGTPRFEYTPAFYFFFFKWQFCIFWGYKKEVERYYEQVLWYLYYADKNIEKAKKTWKWVDFSTKISTWDDNFLIKKL